MKSRKFAIAMIALIALGLAITSTSTVQAQSTVQVIFKVNSLEDELSYSGDILIINGTTFTRWSAQGDYRTTYNCNPGDVLIVTALTPVKATWWGAPSYRFSHWSNGNGLVGSNGTFITPSTPTTVTVTANYIISETVLPTEITVACTPTTVNKYGNTTTTITGTLTSNGIGVVREVELSYFDGIAWIPIQTVVTSETGVYSYPWDVPETVANGQYAIKAEFLGDSTFAGSSATTGSGSSLFVVPEYSWGGLSVVLVCFAAFLVVKARRRSATKKQAVTGKVESASENGY